MYNETKRVVEGAAGRAAVYVGIGLDIPSRSGWGTDVWQSDSDETYAVVEKAFAAGAAGVVASREYEETTTRFDTRASAEPVPQGIQTAIQ